MSPLQPKGRTGTSHSDRDGTIRPNRNRSQPGQVHLDRRFKDMLSRRKDKPPVPRLQPGLEAFVGRDLTTSSQGGHRQEAQGGTQ